MVHSKLRRAAVASFLGTAALAACSDAPGEETGDLASAIHGGSVDTRHAFSVALADGQGIFCSGTLVSRRVVITAGHCGNSRNVEKVLFGTKGTDAVVEVERTIRHPEYGSPFRENDLRVVGLEADAPVQPAPLLRETLDNSQAWVGPPWTFVGYGREAPGAAFGTRRAISYPVTSIASGSYVYEGSLVLVDPSEIYHRSPDKGLCPGDSGGSAFVRRNGVLRLAGVHSRSAPSCLDLGLESRTDRQAIDMFLQDAMDELEGSSPCKNDGVCSEECTIGGEVFDPDCAETHCGADGVCAAACDDPPDPDCAAPSDPANETDASTADAATGAPPGDEPSAPEASSPEAATSSCSMTRRASGGAGLFALALALAAVRRRPRRT